MDSAYQEMPFQKEIYYSDLLHSCFHSLHVIARAMELSLAQQYDPVLD